ncbi:hypothetical protein ABKV19_000159 [Rosa sericea]
MLTSNGKICFCQFVQNHFLAIYIVKRKFQQEENYIINTKLTDEYVQGFSPFGYIFSLGFFSHQRLPSTAKEHTMTKAGVSPFSNVSLCESSLTSVFLRQPKSRH